MASGVLDGGGRSVGLMLHLLCGSVKQTPSDQVAEQLSELLLPRRPQPLPQLPKEERVAVPLRRRGDIPLGRSWTCFTSGCWQRRC